MEDDTGEGIGGTLEEEELEHKLKHGEPNGVLGLYACGYNAYYLLSAAYLGFFSLRFMARPTLTAVRLHHRERGAKDTQH